MISPKDAQQTHETAEPHTKILILEHDPIDTVALKKELDNSVVDYTALIVQTKKQFKDALEHFAPDVILTDYSRPTFKWDDAFHLKQKIAPAIPFILVSGSVDGEEALNLIKTGITDCVFKNRPDSLAPKILRALKEAQYNSQTKNEREALQKNVANLRSVFDHTDVGFVFLNKDLKVVAVNAKSVQWSLNVFGISLKENDDLKAQIIPERLVEFENFSSHILSGNEITYEASYPKINGADMWFHINGKPIVEHKKVIGICISVTDITIRKESEEKINRLNEKLAAANQQLTTILDTLPANIALIDLTGKIIAVDAAWKEFADSNHLLSRAHCVGENYLKVCDKATKTEAQDGREMAKGIRAVLSGAIGDFAMEYPCHAPTEERWFRAEVRPLKKDGNTGAVIMHVNITPRRIAEEHLQKTLLEVSDYKYSLDVSNIVSLTDEHGIIKYANDNFCKISGYSNEELLNQNHNIISSGVHGIEFYKELWRTISSGKVWRNEICNRAKDGSLYWVNSTIVPFLSEAGKPFQYIAIRTDITDRKEAEAALRKLNANLEEKVDERTRELLEANKSLETFSYSVSHDLRSPVRSVMGFASIINKKFGDEMNEEMKELFSYIEKSSQRMNVIIDDLLTLAKSGKDQLILTEVNTKSLFEKVWNNLFFASPTKATFEITELPNVYADRSLLQQVVTNLLSNAIKYSSKTKTPRIRVGCHETKDATTIFVQDNGAGFDMKFYGRLFGAFQRLHGNEEFEGTGVGLTVIKRIIEKHGGEVWAEGKVNHGATFYFSLPRLADSTEVLVENENHIPKAAKRHSWK